MKFAENQIFKIQILLKNKVFLKKKMKFAENQFFESRILPKISLFILICDESKENIAEQTANVKQHCTG